MNPKLYHLPRAPGLRGVALLVGLLCGFAGTANAQAPAVEYQLKASYIYHFTKFIEWPSAAAQRMGEYFDICVVGQDPFGKALDVIAGKPAGAAKIRVQRGRAPQDLTGCAVAFFATDGGLDQETLSGLRASGVLTIGEGDHFLENGGLMRFVTVDDRVRFEINESDSNRSGFRIGAKLMSVAIVR